MQTRTILKNKKARTITARLAFILALFLVLYGAAGYWVTWARETYDKYVQSRNQTFIVHDPFSRKLFDIDSSRVHLVRLGGMFPAGKKVLGAQVGSTDLVSDEYIVEAVDLLNTFDFTFIWPDKDKYGDMGAANILLYYDDKVLSVLYRPDRLSVNGFTYYGDKDFFKRLCAFGEKYARHSSISPPPVY